MNPGKLKHKITFQQKSSDQDENGFPVEGWQDVISVWAMIKTLQGREFYQAATTNNENTSRFVIRYITDINEDMRILFKNRVFEIDSIINDDELNKTLTIIVRELKQ